MATTKKKAKPQQKPTLKKEAMIEALTKALGVVTIACKEVGINRWTHYNWLDGDPEYKRKVEELENVALDFAESQLHKQIKEGEVSATIFFLKTKGKKRGYVERTEISGPDGGPIEILPAITVCGPKLETDKEE